MVDTTGEWVQHLHIEVEAAATEGVVEEEAIVVADTVEDIVVEGTGDEEAMEDMEEVTVGEEEDEEVIITIEGGIEETMIHLLRMKPLKKRQILCLGGKTQVSILMHMKIFQ